MERDTMATDHPTPAAAGDDAGLIHICAELEAEGRAWRAHVDATPPHLDVPDRPDEAERTAHRQKLRQAITAIPALTPAGAIAKARALLADGVEDDAVDAGLPRALLSMARDLARMQATEAR
jgi:hypothetical protein